MTKISFMSTKNINIFKKLLYREFCVFDIIVLVGIFLVILDLLKVVKNYFTYNYFSIKLTIVLETFDFAVLTLKN